MSEITPERIFQIASGFMASKLFFEASEIGLFEKLAEKSAKLDEIAASTGVPSRSVRILADAMVALGFLEKKGNLYSNSPVAGAFLSGRGPADQRPQLRFWNHISYGAWSKLDQTIRLRKAQSERNKLSDEEQKIFSAGVEAVTASSAVALPKAYDFTQHRRVLDVGGGTGSFLIPILASQRTIEATLFEVPTTAAVARARLAREAAGERIKIVEGDLFRDKIPEGHDSIIIANVVHLFSPEHNLEMLKRVRASAAPRARLLLVDFWTDATHTQPTIAALLAGEFLIVTGEGDVYSEEEVRAWLKDSGWTFVERRPLPGAPSLIIAEAK